MNRGFRGNQPNTPTSDHSAPNPVADTNAANKKSGGKKLAPKSLHKAGQLTFLLLLVALIVLAFSGLIFFKGGNTEAGLVDESKYQAVFLNGGQVYFGKVRDLNNKYVDLGSVYYLRVNQQVQPDANAANSSNDISLVKLGCELHGPTDQMVINREQVVFWENLKDDGQVVKAINEYIKQYPEGQKCEEQAATPSTNANTEQNNNNAGNTTTPAPTTNNNNQNNTNNR